MTIGDRVVVLASGQLGTVVNVGATGKIHVQMDGAGAPVLVFDPHELDAPERLRARRSHPSTPCQLRPAAGRCVSRG